MIISELEPDASAVIWRSQHAYNSKALVWTDYNDDRDHESILMYTNRQNS